MAAPDQPDFGLGRSRRLRSSGDFFRLKRDGRRQTNGCVILNWAPAGPAGSTRVGLVTSRQIGGAVERNRARRLLREAFRHVRAGMAAPADVVFVARRSIRGMSAAAVERDVTEALRRARLLAAAPASPAGSAASPT